MTGELLARAAALCVLLASAETLHGIARTRWLVPRVGKRRAQQLGVVSGSLLAFACCAALVPGMGLESAQARLALGAALAAFMAGFDAALGHWLLRKPWRLVAEDFRLSQGHYLVFGLAALLLSPWLLGALAGI